jgi:hypothetical protein
MVEVGSPISMCISVESILVLASVLDGEDFGCDDVFKNPPCSIEMSCCWILIELSQLRDGERDVGARVNRKVVQTADDSESAI